MIYRPFEFAKLNRSPNAPQAFYLADGMYHVVSRHPALRMKNDRRLAGFTIGTHDMSSLHRPSQF